MTKMGLVMMSATTKALKFIEKKNLSQKHNVNRLKGAE